MSYKLLIDGKLVDGASTLDVVNPATEALLAKVPRADAAQAEVAIAAAARAFPAWSRLSYAERRGHLELLADRIEERAAEIARLITQEQGKPLSAASGEVAGTLSAIRWCAAQELGADVVREDAREQVIDQRHPLGVVAVITPWNFPFMLAAQKIAPALITGNTVIVKPAPTTPLSTLVLGEIAADVFPAGVVQTLVDDNDLGPLLTSHPAVAMVSFTGSVPTGKKVLASTSATLKRLSLELGGNDAALILDDADVNAIGPQVFGAAMRNAGQVCVAVKRVYAPRAMVDPLCDIFARLADEMIVGDGLEQGTQMGPVQNKAQYEKVSGLIDETSKIGTLVAGGDRPEGPGYFIRPTVFRDLPADARLIREEQFGPVIPVIAYDDLDEAIDAVNSTEFGLAGSVWSGDNARAVKVASQIDSGTVWINRHLGLSPDIPFGGAKQSGLGRQHGIEGLREYTQGRIIAVPKA